MLTVGDKFPSFRLSAVRGGPEGLDADTAFADVSDTDESGRWKLFFFWPKDFSPVCTTEIAALGRLAADFTERGAVIYGASTDSEFAHLHWRLHHPDLRDLPFAMLSDMRRDLAAACGILDKIESVALRATFLVDPEGTVRFAAANDMAVSRNPQEVLRVLDALRTDAEFCT